MGNFFQFNQLSEDDKASIMMTWPRETWVYYCMQNSVSEEDVFNPILKLIEEDD